MGSFMRTQNETYMIELNKLNFRNEEYKRPLPTHSDTRSANKDDNVFILEQRMVLFSLHSSPVGFQECVE